MAAAEGYCLFDTEFGFCGIAWSEAGLTRVQLPEADVAATRARLEKRGAVEAEPPPAVAGAIARLRAYFEGSEDRLLRPRGGPAGRDQRGAAAHL